MGLLLATEESICQVMADEHDDFQELSELLFGVKENRDAGFEPVYAGLLENAALQENFLKLVFAINQGGLGRFFYRMAPPDRF